MTYAVTGLPAGVTFAAATRTLSASATAALGTVELAYTAEDDDGDTDSGTISLTVVAAAGACRACGSSFPFMTNSRNDRLRWDDATNGLGDVSSLLAVAGTEALRRLQINGNGATRRTSARSAPWAARS